MPCEYYQDLFAHQIYASPAADILGSLSFSERSSTGCDAGVLWVAVRQRGETWPIGELKT